MQRRQRPDSPPPRPAPDYKQILADMQARIKPIPEESLTRITNPPKKINLAKEMR